MRLDYYNVGDFERDAIEKLNQLFKINSKVVMVGGSGLYVKAVTKGLDNFPEVDSNIRERLNERFKNEGLQPLQEELQTLDVASYNLITKPGSSGLDIKL